MRLRKMRARLRLWRRYGIRCDRQLADLVLADIGERICARGPALTDDDVRQLLSEDPR